LTFNGFCFFRLFHCVTEILNIFRSIALIYKKSDIVSTEVVESEEKMRLRLPKKHNNEMFALAERLVGGSRMNVICADGKSRLARIPGRMKRRMKVRAGDLLIIQPWAIQDEKADVVYRYFKTQSSILSRRNLIPEVIDVF